jgi:hypothetical protein
MGKPLPKCPNCGLLPNELTENWVGHTIQFSVKKDLVIDREGNFEPGYSDHVTASCQFGHTWRIKGISCVSELDGYPES